MPDDNASREAFLKAMSERKNPAKRERFANDRATRGLGLCVLVLGVVFIWFGTWEPLQEARAHVAKVNVSYKAILAQPVLIGIGLLYSIMGNSAWRVVGTAHQPSRTGKLLAVAGFVVSLAYLFWVRAQFEALGYHHGQ